MRPIRNLLSLFISFLAAIPSYAASRVTLLHFCPNKLETIKVFSHNKRCDVTLVNDTTFEYINRLLTHVS